MARHSFSTLLALVAVAVMASVASVHAAVAPAANAPYYRFWHGKRLANLSTAAFLDDLRRFIVATTEVGEGVALVSYVPVLTPVPGPLAQWTETALVAYDSEVAYHKLMSSPKGRKYEHSHWNLFNESQSSSHVPPAAPLLASQQPLAIGNATDVLGGTTLWYTQGTAAYLVVHNRTAGSSDAVYQVGVNGYIRGLAAAVGAGSNSSPLLSWVVRLDEDAVYEYQLWDGPDSRAQALSTAAGRAALKPLQAVAARFVDIAAPAADMSTPISYGQGLSVIVPAL